MKILLAFVPVLTAAAPAQQFDLVCQGSMTGIMGTTKTEEPFSRRMRVDLTAKKYCESECKAVRDIAEVGATEITFEKIETGEGRYRRETHVFVNRETGEYTGFATSNGMGGRLTIDWKGSCQKADFSGFPEFKTLF